MGIRRSKKFKNDYKRILRQGCDKAKLLDTIQKIHSGDPLPESYYDHDLHGEMAGFRECHIEPDWLLVYERTKTDLILYRTGSHSDLF